jgi:hypothetical protein
MQLLRKKKRRKKTLGVATLSFSHLLHGRCALGLAYYALWPVYSHAIMNKTIQRATASAFSFASLLLFFSKWATTLRSSSRAPPLGR